MFVNLASLEMKHQEWIWRGRIPTGCITLLQGDPGEGKSTVITDLVARISQGREMPDGSAGASGSILYVTAEDDPQTVIIPRIEAAGGDTSKVVFSKDLLLPQGFRELTTFLNQQTICLLVMDPLSGHVSSSVTNEQKMRSVLTKLGQVASAHNFGVVLVRHHGKTLGRRAITTGLGSTAIAAVARSKMMITSSSESTGERVLSASKSNPGVEPKSLRFDLQNSNGVAVVRWLGESDLTSDDLLRPKASKHKVLDDAIGFIKEVLKEGPMQQKELIEEAERRGISKMTLRRAKEELRIVSAPREYQGPYYWNLPNDVNHVESITPIEDSNSPSVVHQGASNTAELDNISPCPVIDAEQPLDASDAGIPDSMSTPSILAIDSNA